MTTTDQTPTFDEHAIVELLGHRRVAGRVREVQIAGAGFLRIDIPATDGHAAQTQYVSPGSVYALHPTRTHVYVTFADPHLTCDQCGQPVPSWHDPDRCGCDETGFRNQPCGHQAGITSTCPSWNPVDGCRCLEVFGRVDHAPASREEIQP